MKLNEDLEERIVQVTGLLSCKAGYSKENVTTRYSILKRFHLLRSLFLKASELKKYARKGRNRALDMEADRMINSFILKILTKLLRFFLSKPVTLIKS